MQRKNVLILTKREYLARIKTKGFWISTVLLPIAMVGLTVVPSWLMSKAPSHQELVVVDETGQIGDLLVDELGKREGDGQPESGSITFEVQVRAASSDREAQRAELDRAVVDEELDAWIWLPPEILAPREGDQRQSVEYRGRNISNVLTQQQFASALSSAVRTVRLTEAGLDEGLIDQLSGRIGLETIRVTQEGEKAEKGLAGAALAYALGFLLYLSFMLYGMQVLNGVLEEKSSRIVEVMLASVRPIELMMGKILGICLTALTQLVIWIGTLVALTAPGVVATIAFLPEGTVPTFTIGLALHFFAFFLLGFFLVATMYGAIGAAFNDVQEAQQLAMLPMMVIMLPFFLSIAVINAPDSLLATVGSLIPPLSPMLMVTRLSISVVPLWQVALSYLLTAAAVFFMVWLCARIYRTGILMYGKKPTISEIFRWLRHA